MAWGDYFWPGTAVLRNKLGITDSDSLREADHRLSAARRTQIDLGTAPVNQTFDAAHLRGLHAWLFQDLYDWAGHYRNVPIAKLTEFSPVNRVDECVTHAAHLIATTRWDALEAPEFAETAAEVLGGSTTPIRFETATAAPHGPSSTQWRGKPTGGWTTPPSVEPHGFSARPFPFPTSTSSVPNTTGSHQCSRR